MQSQPKAASPAAEDLKEERAIFVHLLETFPQTLRISDLIREMGGSEDFARRDSIERAVRELIQGGLLFRCSGAVLPTRASLRAYELLVGAAQMEIARQFGRNLSTARKEAGMTQGELAARVYMDQGGLSLMERGYRCPRLDQMVKLAEGVGVQVRDLLYGISQMARKPKHHNRKHWPAHRIPLQRAVMALALEVYPHWRTIPELAREIGASGALTRSVIDLIQLGLLENYGSAVRPTKAIAHLERLRLP